ncbi:MAG: YceI family protein [Bacteroidota bacterium]
MRNIIKILLIAAISGQSLIAEGQRFVLSGDGTFIAIKGTSSLHDWEMNLEASNSVFQLNRDGNVIKGIENVSFSCRATDIKSEYSLMDKKTRDALKADEYPEIKFSSISGTTKVARDNTFTGNLYGRLFVAGNTRDVSIPFKGTFTDSNTIKITASAELTLTSFNITPPTAMMGALKTGDQISVLFSLHFVTAEKENNQVAGD